MALQTANQFNLTPANQGFTSLQRSREGTQRLAQGKQVIEQNDQKLALNRARFLGDSIARIRALRQELRAGAVEQLTPRLAEFGIPADSFRGADLSDNALDQALASVQGVSGQLNKLQRGQGTIVQTPQGPAFATEVFSPDGTIKSVLTLIGGGQLQPTAAQPTTGQPATVQAPLAVTAQPQAGGGSLEVTRPGTPVVAQTLTPAEVRRKEDEAFKSIAPQVQLISNLGETPAQQTKRLVDETQKKSDIAVTETEKKERIKKRIARESDIRTEISTRNRNAARSQGTLRQALTLAQQASQGLSGAVKLKLSTLLPGVDSGDEAALDATLKQLALEQLQNFKGPTTDFEFGVTQAIAGALGQSKESNIARIKSLDRARFFNERELTQFNKFTKQGGDPDNFSFDFNEKIVTKKGPFRLQDIQDTAVQNNLTIEETIQRLNR